MYVGLHQGSVDKRTNTVPSNGGLPEKKRMLSIMLCTSWVCAGTFVDHERVSESTFSQHLEDVMDRELNYKIDSPCVVQWGMLWFSTNTRLNGTFENSDLESEKYHEVVNMAIACAVSRSFGGEHTPRTFTLAPVATVLHRTHRKVESEQRDRRMDEESEF